LSETRTLEIQDERMSEIQILETQIKEEQSNIDAPILTKNIDEEYTDFYKYSENLYSYRNKDGFFI
jgi:hypothetical protein